MPYDGEKAIRPELQYMIRGNTKISGINEFYLINTGKHTSFARTPMYARLCEMSVTYQWHWCG